MTPENARTVDPAPGLDKRKDAGVPGVVWAAGAIFAVIIGLFMWKLGMANVVGSGENAAERRAVVNLRTMHWAEGRFRANGFVDADRDGIGEFGTLGQLGAESPIDGGALVPAKLLPMATAIRWEPGGISMELQGFCYRVDLPATPDEAERGFSAWAWPSHGSGGRAFCVDQDETVLQTVAPHGWMGCGRGPPTEGACSEAAGLVRWKNKRSVNRVGAETSP